jgi:hypothetical protein
MSIWNVSIQKCKQQMILGRVPPILE